MRKILVVDDDPQSLDSTARILEMEGHSVARATDGAQALELVRQSQFELIVSDVRMPKMGGLEFLKALSVCRDTTPVILMTAFGRVEDAVWAMKFGAVDFLTKPFKRQALLQSVSSSLKRSQKAAPSALTGPELLGRSHALSELRGLIAQVAPTSATVLITGESGTGKELVARELHRQSARSRGRWVSLNCAAVPEQLMEAELFGHERGAFTGAVSSKEGLFEAAHGGTLFLDEIGELPIQLQAKLLRTIQEGEVRRIGSTQSRKFDVRIVAATNRDLKEQVKQGRFREDLLYRLEVISLHVAPLRERQDDIVELASWFLADSARRHDKRILSLSTESLELLLQYPWPGNVRELSNVIQRAVVFAQGEEIQPHDLPEHLRAAHAEKPKTISVPIGTSLEDVEELLIRKTLEVTDGDKNLTAKLLGINSRTIYRKLDKRMD